MITKDNTSYHLLCLFAFRESPEKQVMEKDLLSSSPKCFQHEDIRWLCVFRCIPPYASQGSETEMLRLILVEGDGKCLCVKAPPEMLKPGGWGWNADKWGHHQQ